MKSILRIVFIFFFATAFFGCANFMNGGDFKEKFDKAVEIANARSVSVEINLRNSKSGSISLTGINNFKVGETFSFELAVNNGFGFDGTFSVFEKKGGQRTEIKDTNKTIEFNPKGEHIAGSAITYMYEATILKDFEGLLINPDIINKNSTEPPKLLKADLNYRYGNDRRVVDYLDLEVYAKEDFGIIEAVTVYFVDENGEAIVCGGKAFQDYKTFVTEALGNGDYKLSTRIDFRDKTLDWDDKREFKIKVSVKNDGNIESNILEIGGTYKKQAYSKTEVCVFNRFEGIVGNYYDYPTNDYLNSEEKLLNHFNSLKLIVFDIDEGLGKRNANENIEIRYGFCQNQDELENLELNNTISSYDAYDFESEVNDQQLLRENAEFFNMDSLSEDEINKIIDDYIQKWNYPYEKREQYRDEALKKFCQSENDKIVIRILTENLYEHFALGEKNNTIINIPVPKNIDFHKNLYIKVSTDTGINNSEYAVFTVPATPKLLTAYADDLKDNDDKVIAKILKYDILNEYGNDVVYYMDPDDSTHTKWKKKAWNSTWPPIYIPEDFVQNKIEFPFYIGSSQQSKSLGDCHSFEWNYYLDCFKIEKCKLQWNSTPLKKFPEDANIELKPKGLGTGLHTITVTLDKNIFDQFDLVILKEGPTKMKQLFMPSGNTISFDVASNDFYISNSRRDYVFSIIGAKSGKTFETQYTIASTDSRVVDNIPPQFYSKLEGSSEEELQRPNLKTDYSGSFISYLPVRGAIFGDNGDGLKEGNQDIDIIYKGLNVVYREETTLLSKPADKRLNIPVAHLGNGRYEITLKLKDKKGNEGTKSFDFTVDKKELSKESYELKSEGSNHTITFNQKGKYSLDIFDQSSQSWKSKFMNKEITENNIENKETWSGNGMIRLYNSVLYKAWYENADVLESYPTMVHFPEQQVSKRDFQLWRNSIYLYSDKPFFIHILQSNTDWGKNEDKQEDKIKEWEKHQTVSSVPPEEPPEKPLPWLFPNIDDYSEANRIYEDKLAEYKGYSPFIGSEVKPVYVQNSSSTSPYIYEYPWEELTEKYAVAIITWADNKKYLVPIDLSMRN